MFSDSQMYKGEGVQMPTINVTNHTSAMNSCVPPKCNYHYKQQWLASQPMSYETFRHVCGKLITNFL